MRISSALLLLIAGRAAHAGRDPAHLEAARVQPLEARARAGGSPPSIVDERHRRRRRRRASRRRPAASAWTFASIAARNRGTDTRPAR